MLRRGTLRGLCVGYSFTPSPPALFLTTNLSDMENYLNDEQSAALSSVLQFNAEREHYDKMCTQVQSAEYNLVALLKPKISIDGNQWCVLYGEDLMNGVAGFGDTPYLAVLDFNKSWGSKIGKQNKED